MKYCKGELNCFTLHLFLTNNELAYIFSCAFLLLRVCAWLTNVPGITNTCNLESNGVLIAAPGKLASTVRTIWTRARAAVISRSNDGITIVTRQAPAVGAEHSEPWPSHRKRLRNCILFEDMIPYFSCSPTRDFSEQQQTFLNFS